MGFDRIFGNGFGYVFGGEACKHLEMNKEQTEPEVDVDVEAYDTHTLTDMKVDGAAVVEDSVGNIP